MARNWTRGSFAEGLFAACHSLTDYGIWISFDSTSVTLRDPETYS